MSTDIHAHDLCEGLCHLPDDCTACGHHKEFHAFDDATTDIAWCTVLGCKDCDAYELRDQ